MTGKPYLYHLIGTTNLSPGYPPKWVQNFLNRQNPFMTADLQAIFNVQTVPYTAKVLDGGKSLYDGIDRLVLQLNEHPGPYILSGSAQGAGVCSAVLGMMQAGDESIDGDRLSDLMFAVMFGNPCREHGVVAPGLSDPGGHGIRLPQFRIQDTPAQWWEFARYGDILTNNEDDPVSELATAVFEFFWHNENLPTDTASMTEVFNEVVRALQQAFRVGQWPPGEIRTSVQSVWEALTWAGPYNNYFNWTPIDGNNFSTVQLAAQEMISLANAAGYGVVTTDVGPVTSGVPASALMTSMSLALTQLGNYYSSEQRFPSAASTLGVVSGEWKSNPPQAQIDLGTFMAQMNALCASYPLSGKLANVMEAARQLSGSYTIGL